MNKGKPVDVPHHKAKHYFCSDKRKITLYIGEFFLFCNLGVDCTVSEKLQFYFRWYVCKVRGITLLNITEDE